MTSATHPAITGDQADRIRESAVSLVASANENMPSERRVSRGTAMRIADRSMLETYGLPFSVREHRASRDVSDFISLAQHNKTNLPKPKNTDLLVTGHPRSTKPHAMTASALKHEKVRWLSSDPSIEDTEIRAIVSSALSATPNTPEHDYYRIRLLDLPSGSIPKALVAAFGDGNSSAARSARARMQRRDRKGRFAWMGGGLRALIRRAGGIFSLSGRMVGQGVGTDDTFDMELPDGRLVRVPAQRAEALKAVITRPGADGYSPSPARIKSGDPVVDESELIDIDAPNGFRADEDYDGPGTRYTDDAYDVVRFDANDPDAPALPEGVTLDPNRPILAASRRDGDKAGEVFEVSQSWANIQDKIRADEVDLDRSEGREPDPIATLDDAEFERLRETVGDTDRDPLEVLREMRGEQAPAAERRGTPDMGEFEFNAGRDTYVFDTTEDYFPRGRGRNNSEEYTDDPELLADMFSSEDLIDAMRMGVLPDRDGNEGSGRGDLDFGEGDEAVPVEAIHNALRLQGAEADMELARIYDEHNGNTDNVDRLEAFRGEAPKARISEPQERKELPPLLEGLTDEEKADFEETGDYKKFLGDNAETDIPEGYYEPDPEPFENVDEDPDVDPVNLATDYTTDELEAAYRESLEPSSEPGYGKLTKTDGDGEEVTKNVPAEALRDALKLNDVDTDELTESIAAEGRDGQDDLDDGEAARILEEEDGQLSWDFTEEEVAQAKEDADALGYEGVSELIDEEPTLDEVVERVYAVGGDDLVRQVFGSRFEQDLYDRETAELVEDPTEEQVEKWTRMDRFLNFLERLGGGPGFIQSEFKPRDGSGDSQAQREKKAREARKRAEEGGEERRVSESRLDRGLRMPEEEQAFIDELKKRREEMDGEEPKTPAEEAADKKLNDEVEEWRERNRRRAERDRERLPKVLQDRIDEIDRELDDLDPNDEDGWIELVAERIRFQQMLDDLTNPAAGRGGGGRRGGRRRPAPAGDGGEPRPRRPRQPRRPRSEEEETPTSPFEPRSPEVPENETEAERMTRRSDLRNWTDEELAAELERIDEALKTKTYGDGRTEALSRRAMEIRNEQRSRQRARMNRPERAEEAERPTPSPEPTPRETEAREETPTPEGSEAEEEIPTEETEPREPTPSTVPAPPIAPSLPTPEEIEENFAEVVESGDPYVDPDRNGDRRTGDRYRVSPNNPGKVFTQDYVDWLLAPERDEDEMSYADIRSLESIVQQMTANEFAEVFGDQDRQQYMNLISRLASDSQWGENRPEGYTGQTDEQPDWLARFNLDVEDVPETPAPEVPLQVAPDAEPPVLRENPIQRRRREARNRNRAAANGRDDAAPDVEMLDKYRNGRRNLLRGAAERLSKAQDQLKKLYAGWEGRGRNMPRPEHIIVSREEDPSLVRDGDYRDRNGNIIRVGDVVAHRRVGDLINPDREAVNLIRGEVVDRGVIVRRDENGIERTYNGYLTVRVLEADDPEWVGEYFTYAAGETEIIRQNRTPEEMDIQPTPEQRVAHIMAGLSDETLYSTYFHVAVGGGGGAWGGTREDDLRLLSNELEARGLVNPQDLGDFLTHITDEALEALPRDIGRNEGIQGRIFRELINNERARRAAGNNRVEKITLPNLVSTILSNNDENIDSDMQAEPATEERQSPIDAPSDGSASGPGLDPRAVPQRYIFSDAESVLPEGTFEGSPSTNGIKDSDLGVVLGNSANPNATQDDYSSQGWDSQRAAEIAEAARSRIGARGLADLILAESRGEATREDVKRAIADAFGVGRIRFGSGDTEMELTATSVSYPGFGSTANGTISMNFVSSRTGEIVGVVTRSFNISLMDPSSSKVTNDYFRITNKDFGGGTSEAYNRWMENWYIANNVPKVDVHAVGDGTDNWTGGVTWALNGFSFQDLSFAERKLSNMEAAARRMPQGRYKEQVLADLERLRARFEAASAAGDRSMYPTPMHYALVGWRPGIEKDWFGYTQMWNSDWYGTKTLSPSSTNTIERYSYDQIMRIARKRISANTNNFTPSSDMREKLSDEDFYSDPSNAMIAPYRDEIIPYMDKNGGSLAELSPVARHAFNIWAVKQLENNGDYDPQELAGLIYGLREEVKAYDKNRDSLGDRGQILRQFDFDNLPSSNQSGQWVPMSVNGQDTGFEARRLPTAEEVGFEEAESGINTTWMIRDTTTGQVYFIKTQIERESYQELYANVIARALGQRGAPYVELADDPRFMITTFAGNGIANGTQTVRTADAYNWSTDATYEDYERFSLAELVSGSILDAVISNSDRHIGNFMQTYLGRYGVSNSSGLEDLSPIMIDHGFGKVGADDVPVDEYLIPNLRTDDYYYHMNSVLDMLHMRMSSMTPEARQAIIRDNALRAIERLENMQVPGMDQFATDLIIERLRQIADIPLDAWAEL